MTLKLQQYLSYKSSHIKGMHSKASDFPTKSLGSVLVLCCMQDIFYIIYGYMNHKQICHAVYGNPWLLKLTEDGDYNKIWANTSADNYCMMVRWRHIALCTTPDISLFNLCLCWIPHHITVLCKEWTI